MSAYTRQRHQGRPQTCTRVPAYRPGRWVKVHRREGAGADLTGKILEVKSLTSYYAPGQYPNVVWVCHFDGGRSVEVRWIERLASPEEIQWAKRGRAAE
jgi:hypothetical protein